MGGWIVQIFPGGIRRRPRPPPVEAPARLSPLEGGSSPAIIRSSVDLPIPFGPTTPIFAPGRNASVTSSRTTLPS